MKYLITGGGTGGHIYPALAIIEYIEQIDPNSEILYLGTKNGLEKEIISKAGYNYKIIDAKPLPRKFSTKIFSSIYSNVKSLFQTRKIIRNFKPNLAIGTGGYVTGSVILISSLMRVPTIIHEQNAYPGLTNKILGRFVDKIFISFDEAKNYFKNTDKLVTTGNPVRQNITEINKDEAYKKFKFNQNKKTILIFGGSGGQKSLNDSVLEMIEHIPEDIQMIYATGKRFNDEFMKALEINEIVLGDNIHIDEYIYNMGDALNIADLVIAPAGAMTLAEISLLAIPSILVPKSNTAENHQYHNAVYFKDSGASVLISEDKLNPELLLNTIIELLKEEDKLEEMSRAAKKISDNNAQDIIKEEIIDLLNKDRNFR